MPAARRIAALAIAVAVLLGCAQETAKKTPAEETLTTALWELASAAETDRDYEKAASYYDRLYERLPDNEKALLGYLRNLRYLGLSRDAIKAAQAGIEKHGRTPDLALELGKSQFAASLVNDARETFRTVIVSHGDRWEAHSGMGVVLDRLGLYDEAQAAFRKALELSPENVSVRNNLALSLAQSGKLDAAIDLLRQVVESERSTPQSRQNLAMLYGLKGELDKAEVLARQDLPPDLVASNMTTFRVLHSSGEPGTKAAAPPNPPKSPSAASVRPPAAAKRTPLPAETGRTSAPPPASARTRGPAASQKSAAAPQRAAPPPRPGAAAPYVSNGAAKVRRGPSTEFEPVAFLKKDDRVRVVGKSPDGKWLNVVLENGRQGYVFHSLVRRGR